MRAAGLALVLMLAPGCAMNLTSTATFARGEKTCRERVWSVVVGTGETEMTRKGCAEAAWSTQDTGISDNGKAALGVIAEGLAKGAIKGAVPVP